MSLPTYAVPSTDSIVSQTFDNGLRVLVYENHAVETIALTGSLRAGSVYEPRDKIGLASMTAAGLMRGTQQRDFDALHSLLGDIGAELELSTAKHRLNFFGRSLAEDLPTLLDVLNDALRSPVYPPEEIEEERQKRLTELNYAQYDTRFQAARLFYRSLYPQDHPYHHLSYGTPQTLPHLTRQDLQSFHARQFGADGMILVVVGAVQAQAVLDMVAQTLGDWHNPAQVAHPRLPQVDAPHSLTQVQHTIPGKIQADLVLGTVGPSRYAEDYLAASLANSILGEFGMMGRIGSIIREQLGLAYYAYSRLDGGEGAGAWQVSAGVAPENVALVIDSIREEIRRISQELVSEDDLADNVSYFTGRLPLRLESNIGTATILHAIERYELGHDYLVTYAQQLARITREDVREAAARYLHPDRLVIAVAEPE